MADRQQLIVRASAAGVVAANYPNDSKLEQAIIYAEKNLTPTTAEVRAVKTLTLAGNGKHSMVVGNARMGKVIEGAHRIDHGRPRRIGRRDDLVVRGGHGVAVSVERMACHASTRTRDASSMTAA